MKQTLFISFLLLLAFSILACKGQEKTNDAREKIQSTTSTPEKDHSNLLTPEILRKDQDPYFIESPYITSSEGPKSITRNIIQDKNGHYWMASWEGIIGFDGKTFTNYTNKDSLRQYHVFSVFEDSKDNIWFGTIGAGLYHYDGKAFKNITTKDGLAYDKIGCFLEDSHGNIWIGTINGLSQYDGKVFRNFTTKEGLSDNDINSIVEDENGHLWFGTRGEACVYDGAIFTVLKNKEGNSFTNVRSIIIDKDGIVWLGGNDGLWSYDGQSFVNYTKDFVGYIYEDKKGNIWTGTSKMGHRDWKLTKYPTAPVLQKREAIFMKEQKGQIFGIIEDKEGNIWYGHERGICRYDGESFENL